MFRVQTGTETPARSERESSTHVVFAHPCKFLKSRRVLAARYDATSTPQFWSRQYCMFDFQLVYIRTTPSSSCLFTSPWHLRGYPKSESLVNLQTLEEISRPLPHQPRNGSSNPSHHQRQDSRAPRMDQRENLARVSLVTLNQKYWRR
jgi:hypothetical protein